MNAMRGQNVDVPSHIFRGACVRHRRLGVGRVEVLSQRHVLVRFGERIASFTNDDARRLLMAPGPGESHHTKKRARLPAHVVPGAKVRHEQHGVGRVELVGAFHVLVKFKGQPMSLTLTDASESLLNISTQRARSSLERSSAEVQSNDGERSASQSALRRFEEDLSRNRVRHGCDREVARELFTRRFSRSSAREFEQLGPLRLAGYSVGADGPDVRRRREILEDFICAFPLPTSAYGRAYIREWGSPGSATRKARTESALRRLIALNGARPQNQFALADWQSDLAWLEQRKLRGTALLQSSPRK